MRCRILQRQMPEHDSLRSRKTAVQALFLDKQHITVDNSYMLLYTVYQEEGIYEDYNQQFIHGTDI